MAQLRAADGSTGGSKVWGTIHSCDGAWSMEHGALGGWLAVPGSEWQGHTYVKDCTHVLGQSVGKRCGASFGCAAGRAESSLAHFGHFGGAVADGLGHGRPWTRTAVGCAQPTGGHGVASGRGSGPAGMVRIDKCSCSPDAGAEGRGPIGRRVDFVSGLGQLPNTHTGTRAHSLPDSLWMLARRDGRGQIKGTLERWRHAWEDCSRRTYRPKHSRRCIYAHAYLSSYLCV